MGRAFASQRVSVCFCFAMCVYLSACESGRLVVFCFATRVCMSACEWSQRRSERPKSALLSIEIDSRRLPNRPSEASKSTPDRPGELQERPRDPKSLPRAPQKRPRASQERPKSAEERPKNAQEHPKSGPRAPRRAPRRLSRRSGEPSGTILTLLSSEKERSAGDPSRNSLEKCVRNDFRSIFALCAQERIREKPVKTIGFYRFFACRLIFERVKSPDQKTTEKSLKSSPRRAKIDLGSIKIAPRSPFRASLGDQVDRRCPIERTSSELVGRKGLSKRLSRRLGAPKSLAGVARAPQVGLSPRSCPEASTGNSNRDII